MDQPTDRFAINPAAQVHVETTSAGCPVLIIDDFYVDPHLVRAGALAGRYDSSLAYYPGLHSEITREELLPVVEKLARLVSLISDISCDGAAFMSDFSIVTTPARAMLAKQKHPHIDPTPLAGVLYLNPDFEIGTSMFRHVPTGLAMLRTPEDNQAYGKWMEAEGELTQPQTYAVGDDGVWQHIHTIAGRFNRLAIYPGNAFHSIAMTDVAANPDLTKARLTQRFFLNRVTAAPLSKAP